MCSCQRNKLRIIGKRDADSLQLLVFFAEDVQVDGSPDAGPLAADDDDCGGVDSQENPCSASAVPRVFDRLTDPLVAHLDLATELFQTHHSATHQTDGRVLRDVAAEVAFAFVVELERERRNWGQVTVSR